MAKSIHEEIANWKKNMLYGDNPKTPEEARNKKTHPKMVEPTIRATARKLPGMRPYHPLNVGV